MSSAAPPDPVAAARRALVVGADQAGQRVDHFLAGCLEISRAEARRLLARGAVERAGRRLALADKGKGVQAGQRLVVVDFRPPEREPIVPEAIHPGRDRALPVIGAGPGWLAVAKPARTGVHPLYPGEVGTVLNELVLRHPEIQGVGEAGLRSGVVHRLDVDTSGVLLVATTRSGWSRLRAAFAEHRVEKVYRAIVGGAVSRAESLRVALAVVRHRPARVAVVDAGTPGARITRLALRPLERLGDASLVEVRPTTGFLHQIRATLAHLGHPVLGDATYAPPALRARAPRQLLHAAGLRFEEIDVHADDEPDFAAALAALRAMRPGPG